MSVISALCGAPSRALTALKESVVASCILLTRAKHEDAQFLNDDGEELDYHEEDDEDDFDYWTDDELGIDQEERDAADDVFDRYDR